MELSPIIVVVWLELTVILIGGVIFLMLSNFSKRSKKRKAVKALFKTIKKDRERRLAELRANLEAYGLGGQQIDRKLREIDRSELNLYQHVGLLFNEGDESLLKTLTVAQEATTAPLLDLDLSAEGNAGGGASVSEAELDALREENKRLESELSITMDTVGRMLSEYSSMFGSEETEGLDKEKIMQSFEADEEEEEDFFGVEDDAAAADAEDLPADMPVDAELGDVPDDELMEISDEATDIGQVPDDELMEISDEAMAAVNAEEAQAAEAEAVVEDEVTEPVEAVDEQDSSVDNVPDDELLEIGEDWENPGQDTVDEETAVDEEDNGISADELDQLAAEVASIDIEDEPLTGSPDEPDVNQAELNDLDIDSLLDEQAVAGKAGEPPSVTDTADLTGIVDIDSDLENHQANRESDIDIEEDDFSDVEIEDMDDIDIDALLNSHLEDTEKVK